MKLLGRLEVGREAAVNMHQRQQMCGRLTAQIELATDAQEHEEKGGVGAALMLFAQEGDRRAIRRQARMS